MTPTKAAEHICRSKPEARVNVDVKHSFTEAGEVVSYEIYTVSACMRTSGTYAGETVQAAVIAFCDGEGIPTPWSGVQILGMFGEAPSEETEGHPDNPLAHINDAYPTLRHPFCTDSDCPTCLHDHNMLGRFLGKAIGQHEAFALADLHGFMGDRTGHAETEHGWAHPDCFKRENIAAFISDRTGMEVTR